MDFRVYEGRVQFRVWGDKRATKALRQREHIKLTYTERKTSMGKSKSGNGSYGKGGKRGC